MKDLVMVTLLYTLCVALCGVVNNILLDCLSRPPKLLLQLQRVFLLASGIGAALSVVFIGLDFIGIVG